MQKPDIELVKIGSLESRTAQLMRAIEAQNFAVVGLGRMHTAAIPGGSERKSLPASLADAITRMNAFLAAPDDPDNMELFKVGHDPAEVKQARALAQFAADMQVAIETNHASRHPDTQKFYQDCVKQILDDPLIKEGGKYHEEFQTVFEDSLEVKRREVINPDFLQIIHNIESVFSKLATLEAHLNEYIPDLDTTEDSSKYFLLAAAKQMLLCRSEEELAQCVGDFKFSLQHSGLTDLQQKQLVADIENCQGSYQKIFQADQRQIKLVGAAVLHVGALGTSVAKSLVTSGLVDDSMLKNAATVSGVGLSAAAGALKESAAKEYSNIVDTPKQVASRRRDVVDLLAPYLLDTSGEPKKPLSTKIKEGASQALQSKWQAIKEKPSEQVGLAATVVGVTALAVPPLAPILLPAAACLALASAAMNKKESLVEVLDTSQAILDECNSRKAFYERSHNDVVQDHGTPEEIEANQKRMDAYLASSKPDLEMTDLAAAASKPSVSPSARYAAYKAEYQGGKQAREDLPPDEDHSLDNRVPPLR